MVWQRCQVHFIRNILSQVIKKDRAQVAEKLREITHAQSRESARKRIEEAVGEFEKTHPKVAEMLEEQGEEILAVYELPVWHRRSMRSTNMLERYNQELKRRTRVIRIFPDQASCLRLITSLAMEMTEEWMGRRYVIFEDEVSKQKSLVENMMAA